MTKRLTPEEEARWDRAWEEAPEFVCRRFRSLDVGDQWHVLILIPAGEAASLGEAVKMVSGGFDDFLRSRREQ